tara:strand:+ start:3815 stop:5380 length:1566 start_codon:yes stop_codon:yes gene_type:complete
MAADKVLADAFARYGQAMGYAQAATDTSNFMMDFLTDMGNEWIKEKEEDKKRFKSYAKEHQNIMNKLAGVSHLKGENYETLSNRVFELVEQGDLALENGDKNGYNQVMQQLDQLKGEMLKIETLFTNLDGDLSAASGTEAPHKIFLGEWKLGFDDDGRITAAGLPNAVGGVDENAYNLEHFLDRLTPNKSAEILQTKENGMLNIIQRAKTYELFDAKDHDPQINVLLNSYTEDEGLMMSVIHDDVFGLTDENGKPILVRDELEKKYPNRNEAYMFEYNRDLTEEDPDNPNKQRNVYDVDKLRADVREILKKHLVKEFNEKVKTFIPKENIEWDNRIMSPKDFNKNVKPEIDLLNDPDQADVTNHTALGISWGRKDGQYYIRKGNDYVPTSRETVATNLRVNNPNLGYKEYEFDQENPAGNKGDGNDPVIVGGPVDGVDYPPISLMEGKATSQTVTELNNMYSKHNVTIEAVESIAGEPIKIKITSADGKTSKIIKLDRSYDRTKKKAAKQIQDFIVQIKTK